MLIFNILDLFHNFLLQKYIIFAFVVTPHSIIAEIRTVAKSFLYWG